MKTLLKPFVGLFRYKYLLTPIAIPVYIFDEIKQKHILVFGFRIACWSL